MKWFKFSSKKKPAVVVETIEMKQSRERISQIKTNLASSFAELETAVAETTHCATALNTRLTVNEDRKLGVMFVSRSGKILFANKIAWAVLRMKNSRSNRRVIRLFNQFGDSQSVVDLAEAVYSGTGAGCFNIGVTTDNFLFKEPVVFEFDHEELSRPVILRVSLADASPQAASDVIFICHIQSAQEDEIEENFRDTTDIGDLGELL